MLLLKAGLGSCIFQFSANALWADRSYCPKWNDQIVEYTHVVIFWKFCDGLEFWSLEWGTSSPHSDLQEMPSCSNRQVTESKSDCQLAFVHLQLTLALCHSASWLQLVQISLVSFILKMYFWKGRVIEREGKDRGREGEREQKEGRKMGGREGGKKREREKKIFHLLVPFSSVPIPARTRWGKSQEPRVLSSFPHG